LVAGLHGYRGAESRRRATHAADRFGLGEDARAYAATYSLGTRKRLALAAALIHDPEILILDEPTNGLDPRAARELREILAGLASRGCTVLLATHLLQAAEALCARVAIVERGRLVDVGTLDELRARHGAGRSLEDLFLAVTERA
jgi:ABC-2 type transport system ATP-binding protein